jgi:hypothetical protein
LTVKKFYGVPRSSSLFSPSNRRWVHRFSEHFPPAGLTRLAAGPSLVALGSKDGKIHVYESSQGPVVK